VFGCDGTVCVSACKCVRVCASLCDVCVCVKDTSDKYGLLRATSSSKQKLNPTQETTTRKLTLSSSST